MYMYHIMITSKDLYTHACIYKMCIYNACTSTHIYRYMCRHTKSEYNISEKCRHHTFMCNQPQFGVVTHVHVYCNVTGERKTMHPQTEILTLPKTQQKQPLHVPVYITDTVYMCVCG